MMYNICQSRSTHGFNKRICTAVLHTCMFTIHDIYIHACAHMYVDDIIRKYM